MKKRSADWEALEQLLGRMTERRDKVTSVEDMLRFARLYRSVCTDLSLAGALRLPVGIQTHLEDLVSRSHNHLYSGKKKRTVDVVRFFLETMPQAVFRDKYVRICTVAFFVPFFMCGVLAYKSKDFARAVLGDAVLEQYEDMHSNRDENPTLGGVVGSTGFYVANNVGIDLLTFGIGILGGVGSLFFTVFNAVNLGAVLGYLLSSPARNMILSWIPGHAPFELTAIGIAAGAGMRIGLAFVTPAGRTRLRALREEARAAIPVFAAGALLTFLAAGIEASIAPSSLPIAWKVGVGAVCTVLMFCYFVLLGGRQVSGHT
ncbi:MAG: stage II sporulation protein M [Spirochaetia bacterium]|nr:stage II sporulation protein M [Spirochaetia bacterium]